jgi:hypothetical protein
MTSINIETAFKSADYQKVCSAAGLRGFPIYMTQKTFADAPTEQNYRLRPQFQQAGLWTYNAKTGTFDDGSFANSTYVLQGKQYKVAHIRIANRKTHHGDTAELNIWATTTGTGSGSAADTYSLIAIPIVSGAASPQGLKLQHMLRGSATASLEDIFPEGDNINVYFYTSCAPYVNVDQKYKPLSYGSATINVAFFNYPIVLDDATYRGLINNTIKPAGIPIGLVGKRAVFSELMETDTNNTVKIIKAFDISEQVKAQTIRKKTGFRLSKDKKQDYKVFEVDPTKLADKNTYKVDLEDSEDLDSYLKRTDKGQQAIADESTIGPGTIARWLGIALGVVLGIALVLMFWHFFRKLYGGQAVAQVVEQVKDVVPALAQVPAQALAPAQAQVLAPAQPTMKGGRRLPPIVKI